MGPRSADRGNSRRGRDTGPQPPASMGPRSADRGNNRCCYQRFILCIVASMGPRSADRGNMSGGEHLERAVKNTEGREKLIAEMLSEAMEAAGKFHGSMGPRSADRGNDRGA